jgi:hypothetical protein
VAHHLWWDLEAIVRRVAHHLWWDLEAIVRRRTLV